MGQGFIFTRVCHSVHKGGGGVGFTACITGHMTGGLHLEGMNPGGLYSGVSASGGGVGQPTGGSASSGGLGRHSLPQLLRDTGGTHPTGMLCCYAVL